MLRKGIKIIRHMVPFSQDGRYVDFYTLWNAMMLGYPCKFCDCKFYGYGKIVDNIGENHEM